MTKSKAQQDIDEFDLKPLLYLLVPAIIAPLATLCFAMRAYVRGHLIKSWGIDDTLLAVAYIIFLAGTGVYFDMGAIYERYGLSAKVVLITRLFITVEELYLFMQMVLKLAYAYFFLRLVSFQNQAWIIRISVIIYILFTFSLVFVSLFACGRPTGYNFFNGSACMSWPHVLAPMNYIQSSLNAIVDITMTLTPITLVMKLRMPLREKLSVALVLLLGALTSIVSIVRIVYLQGLELNGNISFFHKVTPITIASYAETGIGIIAISLAACRPLVDSRTRANHARSRSRGPSRRPSVEGPRRGLPDAHFSVLFSPTVEKDFSDLGAECQTVIYANDKAPESDESGSADDV